ncbi:Wall-associated receptor kinase-like 20 [Morus notabilis]|uniref:non-specific serine/threonine protein kinase n=1 Tax=Morus notabilis TaxID=981085 RepID=W9QQV5_9ROSA|nr:Wall-associated receptor kinase-like 20 [Morus notabilis]
MLIGIIIVVYKRRKHIQSAKPSSVPSQETQRALLKFSTKFEFFCQVNHSSLGRLLGCCVEFDQPMLIYEYISNGTFFYHLHNNSNKRGCLNWQRRLTIAHQTAEGLAYLHNSAIPRIYHRNVKSSNILLDEKLNAKVANFGLSRLAMTETSHITTCAQEEEDVNLAVYVKKILRDERLIDAIESELIKGANKLELETMKALGSLAAACLDERRQNRPTMKHVAEEIEYIIRIVANEVSISTN